MMASIQDPLPFVTIVSGLPRSGTSMMMKMLEAGGVPVCQDGRRVADADNPKGYYEVEKVKDLDKDADWLGEAAGKAIKIISSLLAYVPPALDCRIIFMRRDMEEILASQRQMLERSGQISSVADEVMAAKFSIHLRKVFQLLEQQQRQVLKIEYSDVIADPALIVGRIDTFLGGGLDREKMCRVVDTALYRQRN